MNLFEIAAEKKSEVEASKRGNNAALHSTVTVPYFKGIYRKGDLYEMKSTFTGKTKTGKHKKPVKVALDVKPLTGAFIISYFTCLAYCLVTNENEYRQASNACQFDDSDSLPLVPFNSFLIEALISQEGFSLDDYAQGKTTGAKRIEQHLKAIATRQGMKLKVVDSVIKGITPKIAQSVLSAI